MGVPQRAMVCDPRKWAEHHWFWFSASETHKDIPLSSMSPRKLTFAWSQLPLSGILPEHRESESGAWKPWCRPDFSHCATRGERRRREQAQQLLFTSIASCLGYIMSSGNYQGQLTHITSLLTKSQEPCWQLKKDALGTVWGNVRKLELAQEQTLGLPEGGDDLNREVWSE